MVFSNKVKRLSRFLKSMFRACPELSRRMVKNLKKLNYVQSLFIKRYSRTILCISFKLPIFATITTNHYNEHNNYNRLPFS